MHLFSEEAHIMTAQTAGLLGSGILCGQLFLLCAGGGVYWALQPAKDKSSFAQATKASSSSAAANPAATTEPAAPAAPAPLPRFTRGQVPTEAQLAELTTAVLLEFDNAMTSGNIKGLQRRMSRGWQDGEGMEDLKDFLMELMDDQTSFSHLKGERPIFTVAPALNPKGQLVLKGKYDTKPRVTFELEFAFEDDTWKLHSYTL